MPKISLKSIKSIVLQVLPLMLGVYLGLLANNWNEGKKSKDLEKQILVKLKAEVEENKKQIEVNFDYHKMLMDTSRNYFRLNADVEALLVPAYTQKNGSFWKGTRTSRLKNSVYQAAISSGVFQSLDIELIMLLSELNAVQEDYAKMSSVYLQKAINLTPENTILAYVSFVSAFSQDIYYQEKNLLRLDSIVLEKLEEMEK